MAKYKGFDGMDEFLAAVDVVQQKAPGRLIGELEREAKQVVRVYKSALRPYEYTGNLRRGQKAQKGATKRDDDYATVVYRTRKAAHTHLFNDGHSVVARGPDKRSRKPRGQGTARDGKTSIKQYPSQGGLSRVRGRNVLDRTISNEEPKLQKKREQMIEKIFKELM